MAGCQTRSEFLIRAMRIGIDPDQLVGICKLHSRGLGLGEWDEVGADQQDEVIGDLLDRIEMLNRTGLMLVDSARLAELERCEQTLRHIGELAIERMSQTF